MKQTRALMEGAILISLFAIITLLVVYVPVIGTILLFALPLPMILYTIRHGLKLGIWMGVVSLPVVFIVGSFTGLIVAFMSACAGIAMGHYFKKKEPGHAIISGALIYMLCIVFYFVISIQFLGINIIDEAMTQYRQSLDIVETVLKQSGNAEQLEKQLKLMEEQLGIVQYLFPTAIVMVGAIFSFLSYLIAKPLLRRFSPDIPNLKPFRELKFPQSVVVLYLMIVILSFLPLEKGQMLYSIALNGEFILGFLIFIQGLSFIFFYCHKKQYPKAAAVIAVILGFIHPIFMAAIRILGVIDMGFNIRNKVK
ncbi:MULTISPECIES: YybS family protein [Bacillus]|uniref:YybS family protein n=1 Tax=Bacillus rugosus TaxID=2715209 RepID=A0ACD3ZYU6_9BACI|nr:MULTISPECIES: YybS family protein [Bacillus]MBY4603097.1 YybS family protein [Bacillus sp. SPARC3]UPV79168.1 YybS family protein [Bacillus rugosus]